MLIELFRRRIDGTGPTQPAIRVIIDAEGHQRPRHHLRRHHPVRAIDQAGQ